MQIGPYTLDNPLLLAPMAGVTDLPFRKLCREQGAALAVSEMVSAQKQLWDSRKTRLRLDHSGEAEPRSVQIAGADPAQLADAARFNVERGAQIIDINMGCPAKKVCNVMAGSALLAHEALVANILNTVVAAVDVPVTLKIRTGQNLQSRNALNIARIAEDAGIQALAIHGRTRECKFNGNAEYDTIASVKAAIRIPVIANGDINDARSALQVLAYTGADAIMIGRGAQGRPWIFKNILQLMHTGKLPTEPGGDELASIMVKHLKNLYDFYGEEAGVRIARKHIGWYCKQRYAADDFWQNINRIESATLQLDMVANYLRASNVSQQQAA